MCCLEYNRNHVSMVDKEVNKLSHLDKCRIFFFCLINALSHPFVSGAHTATHAAAP